MIHKYAVNAWEELSSDPAEARALFVASLASDHPPVDVG